MKKLIQTLLCLTILFGYAIANAKPTTFNPNNNLISENRSSSDSYLLIDWTKQVGAAGGYTFGSGASADNLGNVYIIGSTTVGISGQTQNGHNNYFIAKYDDNGKLQWSKQVGVYINKDYGNTYGYGISADSAGNIYVVGGTDRAISGQRQNGLNDYFIAKYDANGNLIWTRQVGAVGGSTEGREISADNSGNIYVTGDTNVGISGQSQTGDMDYFVAKYDADGTLLWTKQVGAAGGTTYGNGISADGSGNIYVSGWTDAAISGQKQKGDSDYFVAKYDSSGNSLWTRQVGHVGGGTIGTGISADNSGNIYITGSTDVPHGSDYFVAAYNASGDLQWTRRGAAAGWSAQGQGISVDNLGNVYVVGIIYEQQTGSWTPHYAVARYDKYGNLLATTQGGAANGTTRGNGISADNSGNVYVTGDTDVGLSGQKQNGVYDYFVAKYMSIN